MVLPSLAVLIGLNEAIVLQQVHYWINTFRKANKTEHIKDNEWWVYNTYDQWQKDNFPWWSLHTVRRAFESLRSKGVLIKGKYNENKHDHTSWYRIDYDKLNDLVDKSMCPKWTEPNDQDGQKEKPNLDTSYTETTAETTQETTTDKTSAHADLPAVTPEEVDKAIYSPKSAKPKKERNTAHSELFGALVQAFGYDASKMTATTRSQFGKVARELNEINFPAGDVPSLYKFVMRDATPTFKPTVFHMASKMSEFLKWDEQRKAYEARKKSNEYVPGPKMTPQAEAVFDALMRKLADGKKATLVS